MKKRTGFPVEDAARLFAKARNSANLFEQRLEPVQRIVPRVLHAFVRGVRQIMKNRSELDNLHLVTELAKNGANEVDDLIEGLIRMTGRDDKLLAIAVPDNKLVGDILDPAAIDANNSNHLDAVADEFLHKIIQPWLVS